MVLRCADSKVGVSRSFSFSGRVAVVWICGVFLSWRKLLTKGLSREALRSKLTLCQVSMLFAVLELVFWKLVSGVPISLMRWMSIFLEWLNSRSFRFSRSACTFSSFLCAVSSSQADFTLDFSRSTSRHLVFSSSLNLFRRSRSSPSQPMRLRCSSPSCSCSCWFSSSSSSIPACSYAASCWQWLAACWPSQCCPCCRCCCFCSVARAEWRCVSRASFSFSQLLSLAYRNLANLFLVASSWSCLSWASSRRFTYFCMISCSRIWNCCSSLPCSSLPSCSSCCNLLWACSTVCWRSWFCWVRAWLWFWSCASWWLQARLFSISCCRWACTSFISLFSCFSSCRSCSSWAWAISRMTVISWWWSSAMQSLRWSVRCCWTRWVRSVMRRRRSLSSAFYWVRNSSVLFKQSIQNLTYIPTHTPTPHHGQPPLIMSQQAQSQIVLSRGGDNGG